MWPKNFRHNWKFKQEIAVRFGEPVVFRGDLDNAEEWAKTGEDITNRIAELVASIKTLIPDRRRPKKAGAATKS